MTPLISIIMPMRNASLWVKETIDSIQKQTVADWELIVVDDHSTDESVEIIESIAVTDKRIKILQNPSEGIIPALKYALENCRGTFITRMDSDDIMPVDRLALHVDALQNAAPKTIVTGKVRYFSSDKVSDGYLKYENWLNERVDQADFYDHIYRECIVASPNWMGRTEEFKNESLFSLLNYPEDYDLCFRWQEKGFTIIGLETITLHWREHPLRTSRNSDNYQQEAFFQLKMDWFSKNHSDANSIGIVGIGQKGKLCLEYLNTSTFDVRLFDLNHTQFTQPINGMVVESIDDINTEKLLIARYPTDISAIQQFIEKKGYCFGKTAFWV